MNKHWLTFISSPSEILCVRERHHEVCKACNWCRYYCLSTNCLSFFHSDTCRSANKVFPSQLKKGKLHGCIDVGLSVMSIKKKAMCIDLDTEDNIFHLKVFPEKCCCICHLSLPTWFLFIQGQPQQLSLSPAHNLTSCHPGEVSWTVWWVGVKTATSPCVSAERDCHVSPWEASVPPQLLILPLPHWLPEKSKLFQCLYVGNIF